MIVGIDEVGRGPWAGPLVMGAVVLGDVTIPGLTDSKKLSKNKREVLAKQIIDTAEAYGIGWVDATELDEIGLSAALVLCCRRALEQITVPYHEIIIDGTVNFLKDTSKGEYVTTMKKADLLIASVSAASIIAKVARDDYMVEADKTYPGYGFASHVGYGTAAHRAAIESMGVTPIHRLSFAPLRQYADDATVFAPRHGTSNSHTSKSVGDDAENLVAEQLVRLGHEIVERNWKTRFCEIDIVSRMNEDIYFTEVKYRKSHTEGGGIAAITPKKLRQMKFAAQLYAAYKNTDGMGMRLQAASVMGVPLCLEQIIEINQ